MKFFISLIFTSLCFHVFAQNGIHFEEITFTELLTKAKTENRWIFLDAYTSWCGPCKQMADKVFVQKKVGNFFNQNFINVKYDMEQGEGPALAAKLGIGAYPTFVLIKPDGTVHHKMVGGMDADELILKVKKAQRDIETIGAFAARYDAGERDKTLLVKYLNALMEACEITKMKEVSNILINLLNDDEKVQPDCWILFNNDDLAKLNSANHKYLLQNRMRFNQSIGEEKVDKRLFLLYASGLSNIIWGRDKKNGMEEILQMENEIRPLAFNDRDRLLTYIEMVKDYKTKKTDHLLLVCEENFSKFSDQDILVMVMPVSVYIRQVANKDQMSRFIAAGKTIFPNLKEKDTKNYVIDYFETLEKQLTVEVN